MGGEGERLLAEIAERKRAERELGASRESLHLTFENAPIGLTLSDLDNRFIKVNKVFAEMVGKTPAELVGITIESVTPPEDYSWERVLLKRMLEGEVPRLEYSKRAIRADGSLVALRLVATLVRDEGGAPVYLLRVIEDITEKLRAAAELDQLRKEWVSLITHELRQPVTAIAAHASLLFRESTDDRSRLHLSHIQTGAHNLSRMIEDLMEGSLLDAKHLTLELREVDLVALVWGVVERRAHSLADHGVSVEASGQLPRVKADPERIEQVLGNLLSNATKYGYEGCSIRITLSLEGGAIRVAISNEGVGLQPAELQGIFERFRRRWTGGKVGGLGLGLYIVKGLVQAHGGEVEAASIPGGTTTFSFTLPITGSQSE